MIYNVLRCSMPLLYYYLEKFPSLCCISHGANSVYFVQNRRCKIGFFTILLFRTCIHKMAVVDVRGWRCQNRADAADSL